MSDEQQRSQRRDPWAPPPSAAPQAPYGPPYPYAAWLHPAPRNGPGTAALVLGVAGTVAAITCFGVVVGLPLGILAVVFGAVGWRRARRGEATNGGQALSGAILGAAAVLLSIAMIALVATSVSSGWFGFGGPDVSLVSGRGGYDRPLGAGGAAVFEDGTRVTVSQPRAFTPPAGADGYSAGDRAYRFEVTVRNTGGAGLGLGDYTYYATAGDGQDDLQLISTDTGELAEDFPATLAPGRTATVVFAFDVPPGQSPLRFDFEPTTGHEDANWQLELH